jgi:molecular chaperone HtpG
MKRDETKPDAPTRNSHSESAIGLRISDLRLRVRSPVREVTRAFECSPPAAKRLRSEVSLGLADAAVEDFETSAVMAGSSTPVCKAVAVVFEPSGPPKPAPKLARPSISIPDEAAREATILSEWVDARPRKVNWGGAIMTEPSSPAPEAPAAEQHRFQAEVSQVLHLVIHSLYSHKEIFLRELISNASDALDRLRFRSITEPGLLSEGEELEIRIVPDKERGTLTIEDTGVGMTKEELVKDLGTVARSGSKAFLEALQKSGQKDLSLIGQFGVGFYSAYLVADKVEVQSRAAGTSVAWRWASDATESFTIEPVERLSRGTSVVLHLKKDQREFLETWRLKSLVTRYSDYVSHPIKLLVEKTEGQGTEAKKTTVLEQVNRASALWQRPKSEITAEQYDELYQHLTHDTEPPLARTHFKVEGTQEFAALLFVPRRPPFDLRASHKARGIQLFVKRVLVMEECEELLPEWLRFVRGVVDSDDLPLNVSREILQDSQTARTIKKQLVKATLDMLDALVTEKPDEKDEDTTLQVEVKPRPAPLEGGYDIFWEHFGVMIKEGLAVDYEHKDRLAKLVRWPSSKASGLTSLADYVLRMPLRQEAIYYVLGESKEAVESSPHLEELKKRGYEVLYMTDAVDEWAAEALGEYEGKKVVSAMRADLKFEETPEKKKEKEESTTQLRPLLDKMKSVLGDAVVDVRVSERLTDSPSCLVLSGSGPHAFVDRLLRERGKDVPHTKRILEINPSHPVIVALLSLVEKEPNAERLKDWIEVLYDQALLTEGSALVDPNRFARRVTALMTEAAKGVPL